jgi:hypothetical protein
MMNTLVNVNDVAVRLNLEKRRYKQKVKQLETARYDYEKRWKNIRDYQLPHIGYFDDTEDSTNYARRRDTKIYNGVAWESNIIFASGLMSGLTPPSRQWFRLAFTNRELSDNSDFGAILDQRLEILNDVLNKSNFYNAIHSDYLEIAFGQAVLSIFLDSKTGVHFVPYTIGTYYIEQGPDRNVNTILVKTKMTALQLQDKFGIEVLPQIIQNNIKNNQSVDAKYTVNWLVEPNRMADANKIDKFHMPFISVYWLDEAEENEWLSIGGFHEFPAPVARYLVNGNETYAKAPGWFAEADNRSLQVLEKDDLVAVELGVKPPMQGSANTAMKGVNLAPGSFNVTETEDGIKPLFQVGVNLQHLHEKIQQLEERIKRAYSADLFRMFTQAQNDKNMTARETIARTQENLQQLGPVVERLQFEFLSPIIERVYNILDRAGIFPPIEDPDMQEILNGEEIKIEYISPLAQAQKMSGLVNIEQAYAFVMQLAQGDPNILHKFNFVEALNRYFEMLGAPSTIRRTDDEYNQIMQGLQQQAQKQEAEQNAMNMIQAAVPAAQAAKNATEAANDGNPALQQFLGIGRT